MSTSPRTVHTSSTSSGGIGCLGLAVLISIVLGVLKLAGVLEMSWLLVASPVLAILGVGAVALLILLLVLGIIAVVLTITGKRGRR